MSDTDHSSREEQNTVSSYFGFEAFRQYHLFPFPSFHGTDARGVHRSHRFDDDEALSGLQKFCDDPDERCDTFSIHGFYFLDGDPHRPIPQRLTLSDRVASAVLQTLDNTRTLWKRLHISATHVNAPLLQVMEAAKSLNTIYSFSIKTFDDPVFETFPVLSSFVVDNPILTELNLLEVALDLPCLDLLKTVLITTPISTSECDVMNHSQSRKPPLTSLEIKDCMERRLSIDHFKVLSAGFRYNQRLINLSLLKADFESSFPLESLIGHPALETLNVSECCFSDAAILSLAKVLHHPSCRIKSLHLDECGILISSDFIGPMRLDVLANALANGICSSIICLSLENNYASCDELQNLMMAIHKSCPNLEVVDLTGNCVKQIIWKHSDAVAPVLCANEPLSSLAGGVHDSSGTPSTISSHKACALQSLILDKNDVLHKSDEEERSSTDNANFEELLLDFPALGQITQHSFYGPFIRFSPKVHTLMSFNRLTRGRLSEGQLPASLWYKVLARIPRVLEKEEREMGCFARENDLHARICQASVLFALLNRHPSQVTLAACRAVPDETRCSLNLPLEAFDSTWYGAGETIPTKRRKLE